MPLVAVIFMAATRGCFLSMNDFAVAFLDLLQKQLPTAIPFASLFLLLTVVVFGGGILMLSMLIRLISARKQITEIQIEAYTDSEQIKELTELLQDARIRETRALTLLQNERQQSGEKLKILQNAREELKEQFENLAGRIFEDRAAKLSNLNREKLSDILSPFHQQLTSFKQEISEIYRNDNQERLSLKNEIHNLRELNRQINQEAINLTRALKSDTKAQGNWGELVLERILEGSGLRKGHEFTLQEGYRDDRNRLFKPDVVIHLPTGRHIIIDAKVSLNNWERYVNEEDGGKKQDYLRQLIKDIRNHINGLSEKNYQELRGLRSLDFVLLFLPIEAAFSTACQEDDTLIDESLKKSILLVTPTTLLAALRTVENIWQYEHQSKHALEIARRAGFMYDKFRGFIEDLEKIGLQLSSCQNSYQAALTKLTSGRSNLIAQAERLTKLGVHVKKKLPQSVTELAELETETEQHLNNRN